MSIFSSTDELQGELSLQCSAAGSIHCSSWKKGLNEHKYHYKSGSCISSAMLSLTKKQRIVIPRVPDSPSNPLTALHLSSVGAKLQQTPQYKKPPWWALWSGRKLKSAWNCQNAMCPATLKVQCDLAAAGNDRAIFWGIQEHNITGPTHGELHSLQTCPLHCIPSPLTAFCLWETSAGPISLSFILGWKLPETPLLLSPCKGPFSHGNSSHVPSWQHLSNVTN